MPVPQDLPNWLVAIIVLAACVAVSILLALIGKVLRYLDILPGGGAPFTSPYGLTGAAGLTRL